MIVTVNFAKKSILWEMGSLDAIWAEIMQPYPMISSKDLFEMS